MSYTKTLVLKCNHLFASFMGLKATRLFFLEGFTPLLRASFLSLAPLVMVLAGIKLYTVMIKTMLVLCVIVVKGRSLVITLHLLAHWASSVTDLLA